MEQIWSNLMVLLGLVRSEDFQYHQKVSTEYSDQGRYRAALARAVKNESYFTNIFNIDINYINIILYVEILKFPPWIFSLVLDQKGEVERL